MHLIRRQTPSWNFKFNLNTLGFNLTSNDFAIIKNNMCYNLWYAPPQRSRKNRIISCTVEMKGRLFPWNSKSWSVFLALLIALHSTPGELVAFYLFGYCLFFVLSVVCVDVWFCLLLLCYFALSVIIVYFWFYMLLLFIFGFVCSLIVEFPEDEHQLIFGGVGN